jgi:hypothetical protein
MQMLHPFAGSIQHYLDQIADPNRYRPDHCPQCEAKRPLTGHGFYHRILLPHSTASSNNTVCQKNNCSPHQSPGEWQDSLLTCLLDFDQAGFSPAG